MSFESIIGQRRPKNILQGALERNTLASSYLFFGPSGVGKLALALELAKAVNCSAEGPRPCQRCSSCRRTGRLKHPDVSVIFPRPKKITEEELHEAFETLAANPYRKLDFPENIEIHIDTMRQVRSDASYKPYEGRKKVFIVAQAHKLNLPAANALLKTLEEPPAHVLIILTSHQPGRLPPTVLSRCQQIRFAKLSQDELFQILEKHFKVDPAQRHLVIRLAQGSVDRAYALLQEDIQAPRAAALKLLSTTLKGDLEAIVRSAQRLSKWQYRAARLKYVEALQILYRDLLLLLEGKEEYLVNTDLKSQLARLASQYDWQGVQQSLSFIEESRRAIEANVNLDSIWMVLLFRLKRSQRL